MGKLLRSSDVFRIPRSAIKYGSTIRLTLEPMKQSYMHKDLPVKLNFRDVIRNRCPVSPDLFEAAIEFIEDQGRWEVHQALGWRVSLNWQTRKPHDFGITAAFRNEDGSRWQFKPEFPTLKKDGTPDRYLAPIDNGSRAFLPEIDPATRKAIERRHNAKISPDGSFWGWVEGDEDIPIVITEGGFKALAALDLGYICLSLYGINSGVSKFDTIGGEKVRKLNPELIPDLQRFAKAGRRVVLAFDQDAALKTRNKVQGALSDLSWHLERSGCEVLIAQWDGQGGKAKGLDDLIASQGPDAWHSAYKAAIPANQWRIQNDLARAVKRRPDLDIADREFSEVADMLPTSGLVVLQGFKGSGKSEAIAVMKGDRPWISSTPLISLGRDQAATWGGVFINDGDRFGGKFLKDGQEVSGAAVCIPSLPKVSTVNPEVFIVDEVSAHLDFLLTSPLANKDGARPILIAEHNRLAGVADLVVCACADITEEAIAYYEAVTGQRAYLVRSTRRNLRYQADILDCTYPAAIAAMQQRIEAMDDEAMIYINTDSKKVAKSIGRVLEEMGITPFVITSETSGGQDEAAFLESKGRMIPELLAQGIRAIVSSPTIAQGFSIKHHTDRIDSVWGFYRGGSIPAHGMAQALDRVRSNDAPRFIHVAKKGSAYSKLSKAQSVAAFTREFQQLSTATARLVRLHLTPEAIATSDSIDWQGGNLKMLAALEVRRNRGMGALRDTVIALLRHEGKSVHIIKPQISKSEAKTAMEIMKQASKAIDLADAQAIANAQDITEDEADRLSVSTEPLTPEQINSIAKLRLQQFYQVDSVDVSAQLALYDRGGRKRTEIRNLERLRDGTTAAEVSARSINNNADNPQDWNRAALYEWLEVKAGVGDLVEKIVNREITTINAEICAPIGNYVRQYATEYRLATGIKSTDEISDQQIVGQFLSHNGIRTKRNSRQKTYAVDYDSPEHGLDLALAVIDRRKNAVTSPSDQQLKASGCDAIESPDFSSAKSIIAPTSIAFQSAEVTIEYADGIIETMGRKSK